MTAPHHPAHSTTSSGPPRGGDTVITVSNLRKVYGTKVAVEDVSFEVARGEIFGILGPNGAGKTTTVETLAGLRTADGGTLRILGVDPQRDPATVREQVGIQLQESTMQPKLTVREALRLYAAFYPNPAEPEDLIRRLGLTDRADTRFENLSGGQKQRLSIALALVGRPQIAILDELTTGLDPQARRDTWNLIEQVRDEGVTILLVTHFMDEAERLCDRLVIIDDGTVVREGSPEQLTRNSSGERYFRITLPATAEISAADFDQIPEVSSARPVSNGHGADTTSATPRQWDITGADRVLAAVVAALDQRGIIPDDLRTSTRTLEDVFVDVVREDHADSTAAPQEAS